MKVTVYVSPKKTVVDPQGKAVGHAMEQLQFKPSGDVRVGKIIEFEHEGEDSPETRAEIDRICQDLLSNPIIEDYRYDIA